MQMNLTLLEGRKQIRRMDKCSSWAEEQKEDNAMIKKKVAIQKKFTPMTVLVGNKKQQQQNLPKPKAVSAQLIQLWCKTTPVFTG